MAQSVQSEMSYHAGIYGYEKELLTLRKWSVQKGKPQSHTHDACIQLFSRVLLGAKHGARNT